MPGSEEKKTLRDEALGHRDHIVLYGSHGISGQGMHIGCASIYFSGFCMDGLQEPGRTGGVLLGIFLVGYGVFQHISEPFGRLLRSTKGPSRSCDLLVVPDLSRWVQLEFYLALVLLQFLIGSSRGIVFPSASKVLRPGSRLMNGPG